MRPVSLENFSQALCTGARELAQAILFGFKAWPGFGASLPGQIEDLPKIPVGAEYPHRSLVVRMKRILWIAQPSSDLWRGSAWSARCV